jgi:hypothetical protein
MVVDQVVPNSKACHMRLTELVEVEVAGHLIVMNQATAAPGW